MSHQNDNNAGKAAERAVPAIEDIVDDLGFFDDWEDRYRYLIDLGRALPEFDPASRTEDHLVRGCQSQVWLTAHADSPAAPLQLTMDSDALIVRGLLGLIYAAYAGRSSSEVLAYDIEGLFEKLDLLAHLSMTRGNGLRAMVGRIHEHARQVVGT